MKQVIENQSDGRGGKLIQQFHADLASAIGDIQVADTMPNARVAKKALSVAISRLKKVRKFVASVVEMENKETSALPLIASPTLQSRESELMQRFIAEMVVIRRGANITEQELYDAYVLWCRQIKQGGTALLRVHMIPVFRAFMAERGIRPARNIVRGSTCQRGFRGILLNSQPASSCLSKPLS
ncbi:MAG: hypothetical protein LBK99_16655 [Opitutaceae bacterium]|nr:hypothetical protein [Opitutaceae bacterium]